eukprot:3792637-Pleurochrysis_carterae.AAC.1
MRGRKGHAGGERWGVIENSVGRTELQLGTSSIEAANESRAQVGALAFSLVMSSQAKPFFLASCEDKARPNGVSR